MRFSSPLTKSSQPSYQNYLYQNPLDQYDQNQTINYKPFAPYVYGKPKFNTMDSQNMNHLAQQRYLQQLQQTEHLQNKKLIEDPFRQKLHHPKQFNPPFEQQYHQPHQPLQYQPQLHQLLTSNVLKCPQHPTHSLTNICTNPSCLLPLCPICIDEHGAYHKERNDRIAFEPLEDVTGSLIENVAELEREVNQYQLEVNRMQRRPVRETAEGIRQVLVRLIDRVVNEFIAKYQQLEETVAQIQGNKQRKKIQDLSVLAQSLQQLERNLIHPSSIIQYTVAMMKSDILPSISKYLNQSQFLVQYKVICIKRIIQITELRTIILI